MDPTSVSISSVLEALLKTNQPPTDPEKAIIQESMKPTNAKLKVVKSEISDAIAHIQALKLQIEHTESKLQRLREKETAILETIADHHRVLSPFRNLPGDILRELCIACVENDIPTLSFPYIALPYILAKISSEIRHIVLTTPSIWASIVIEVSSHSYIDRPKPPVPYSILARRAREWFQRAGGLALDISVKDTSYESVQSNVLFDCLLGYSPRWKAIRLNCWNKMYPPLSRIAALTSANVPLLQSISLQFTDFECDTSAFRNSTFFTIPTLKHLMLDIHWKNVADFNVNWEILTSITLAIGERSWSNHASSVVVTRMLQKTKRLVSCDISVDRALEGHPGEVYLPLLEVLSITERINETIPTGICSTLDLVNAPILNTLNITSRFSQLSLSTFLRRTSSIRELSLPWMNQRSLTDIAELLHCCPLLSALLIRPSAMWEYDRVDFSDANEFLQAFVQDGNSSAICPRLEYFSFMGGIDLSFQTLRQFLEGKQGANAAQSTLLPWKGVTIDLTEIPDAKIYQQMLDFVSQKVAEGLEVKAFMKYDSENEI